MKRENANLMIEIAILCLLIIVCFTNVIKSCLDCSLTEKECPSFDCPDCNVSCPACPVIDCQALINVTQGIESPPEFDSSFGSFIFDSKCSGTLVKNLMYSVDRGLCRRDQFDGVRSGYSPERCCLNVGGMTFVGCVTAGDSAFVDSNNEWVKLGCYK